MAKRKVNKTQAVTEYVEAHPEAVSSEIADALGKKGVKITAGYVSNIKSKLKKGHRGRKARTAEPVVATSTSQVAAVEPVKTNGTLSIQHVKAVAQTAKAVGGFNRLNELLNLIREVGGMKRFGELIQAMSVAEPEHIPF